MTTTDSHGDEVLTVRELADELRVGQHAAYQLVARGAIRSVRIGQKGGGIRIPRSALADFLGQRETH